MTVDVVPFKHQRASLNLIRNRKDIPYVLLIGGYGSGKSFCDVLLLCTITSAYMNSPVPLTFGIIGVTLKLLGQTVLKDFKGFLDSANIPYSDNIEDMMQKWCQTMSELTGKEYVLV